MCGRFTLRTPAPALIEHFQLGRDAFEQLELFAPRYNIAPTQQIGAVRASDGVRTWSWLRWGLIPSWTKSLTSSRPLINARSETVAEKPSFRTSFKRRRCLIPADGFYEWHVEGKGKQPYHIHLPDDQLFAFAGLWEWWGGPDKKLKSIESCTLLTTAANKTMQPIHDRMPVIIQPVDYDLWLDPDIEDPQRLDHLLRPSEDVELQLVPVDSHVNRPSHDDPECVEPIAPAE
ncbi:MAG: SOS response-associated peptidase [Planctomycetales bacterium]|nr:SOS response-associated peptidase [Planctomycetales bacterium]